MTTNPYATPPVPVGPRGSSGPTGTTDPPVRNEAARPWTVAAFAVLAAFVVWLPLVFALGYWMSTWFGVDPGSGETVVSTGWLGWVADLAFGLVVGAPAWLGAGCAARAHRLGAGAVAVLALALDVVVALAFLLLCVLVPL